ncbi:unnamed protein product, partial [Nesidiocoris tenuis]
MGGSRRHHVFAAAFEFHVLQRRKRYIIFQRFHFEKHPKNRRKIYLAYDDGKAGVGMNVVSRAAGRRHIVDMGRGGRAAEALASTA